jgi:hypothetical protein
MARFYADSTGADERALSAALAHLKTLARQGIAGVFVRAKADLRGNVLGELIGEDALRKLERTGTATALGLTFTLLTTKKSTFAGPVLALHVSAEALDSLAGTSGDVIFVPWMKEELAAVLKAGGNWIKIYG